MRHQPTDAEQELWSLVRAKRLGGHKFKRQEQIGNFIVDFVCFERRLIIEADGGQHNPDKDALRDNYLTEQGFTVLRFWNNDILTNPEGVAATILAALTPPLPNLSPARGEGLNSSPLAGEEGARRAAVGRRGDQWSKQ